MKRFAIMAVLGAMLCGSLVAGCGGPKEDLSEAPINSANGVGGGNGAGGGNTTGAGAGADAGAE